MGKNFEWWSDELKSVAETTHVNMSKIVDEVQQKLTTLSKSIDDFQKKEDSNDGTVNPLSDENYELAGQLGEERKKQALSEEEIKRQQQVAESRLEAIRQEKTFLESESESVDNEIKLSQRRINNLDNMNDEFANYYAKQHNIIEDSDGQYSFTLEQDKTSDITSLADNYVKEVDSVSRILEKDIEESKKAQEAIDNISNETLSSLGYLKQEKTALDEIRESNAEFRDSLTRIEESPIDSLLPDKSDLKDSSKNISKAYDEIIAEKKATKQALDRIELTPIDTLSTYKNQTLDDDGQYRMILEPDVQINTDELDSAIDKINQLLIEESDGQIAFDLEELSNGSEAIEGQKEAIDSLTASLFEEVDGQMAFNLSQEETSTLRNTDTQNTIRQTTAKEALIEAQNRELLANVQAKMATMGYTSANEELTIAELQRIAAGVGLNAETDREIINLAKATLATLGFKNASLAATIATKGLALAGNMLAGFGISFAISKITEWINKWANAASECREEVEELISTYNDSMSTANSNYSKIDELGESYATLSKGVDEFGNNVSLTSEQFEKYNSVVNDIATMFPELVTGWNSQSIAILNVKDGVDSLTAAYKENVKAAAQAVVTDSKTVYKDYKKNKNSSWSNILGNTWTSIWNRDKANWENVDTTDQIETLKQALTLSYDDLRKMATNFNIKNAEESYLYYALRNYGITDFSTDKELDAIRTKMQGELTTAYTTLDNDLSGKRTLTEAWFKLNENYSKLTDSQISAISTVISNMDTELADTLNSDAEVNTYINNLISGITDKNGEISKAFSYLFTVDVDSKAIEETKANIDDYVQQIVDYTGLDIETIKEMFDLTEYFEKYDKYISAKDKAKEKLEWTDDTIQSFFDDNSVNTLDEYAVFYQVADAADEAGLSVEEFAKKYKAALEEAQSAADNYIYTDAFALTDSDDNETVLGKLSSQIDEIQTAYSTLSSAMTEYANTGSYSVDTLQSILGLGDQWLAYLVDENGYLKLDEQSLEDLTKARLADMKQQVINNMIDTVSSLSSEIEMQSYLAQANYETANSYEAIAEMSIAAAEATLRSKIGENGITSETVDKVINNLKSQIATARKLFDNTDVTSSFSVDSSASTSLSALESHASLVKTVSDEYAELGKLSTDTLTSITAAYSDMDIYVRKYQLGLMTEEELFAELEKCYESDVNAYKQASALKMQCDEDFTNQVLQNYPELFNEIKDAYGTDYQNFKNLEQAKLDLDNKITEILKTNWGSYLTVAKNGITSLYEVLYATSSSARFTTDDSDYAVNFVNEEEYQESISQSKQAVEQLNNLQQVIDDINSASLDVADIDLGSLDWSTLSSSLDDAADSASDTSDEMDWLERAIKKVERAYNRLKDVSSDTTRSWATRNAAVSESMSELTKQIELQTQAYEYYMQLFWALDLDDYYKQLIMDGAMFVETITDPDLLELINKAIELFDKAQDAQDSVSSLTAELHELSTEIFDNTAKEYEQMLDVYDHAMKTLENAVSLIETKGYKVTANLYEAMISQTEDQLAYLQEERAALEEAMASADVEAGSEAWMDMYNQILDVDNAIQEATISLAEFNNELRQLKWDKFDDIQSGIQETIDEADFLYTLLSNRGLTDEDSGGLNDRGIAAQGLLAEKYDLYMALADRYAQAVKDIDAELASDPNNVDLLERRQELLKAQREAILNAEEEKQAIADLIEEAYSALGDTLSDLIDKYKDFLDTIKDTFDYEKEMAEKTAELADLQKQYAAIRNDDSEEGMTRRQQLESQIKESEQDIEQTEYEKLISDTEKLLDKFQSEYEEWITNLVTELETTLEMAIEETNQYSDQILSTLEDQAYNVGYTLSDTTTAVFSSIGDAVSVYGQGFLDAASGINNSIGLVISKVEQIYNSMEALTIANQAIAQAQSMIATALSAKSSSSSSSSSSSTSSGTGTNTATVEDSTIGVGSVMTLNEGSKYWETSWGNGLYGTKYAGVQGGVVIDEMSVASEVEGGTNNPSAYGDYYVHIKSADGVYQDLGWVRWSDLSAYGKGTKYTNEDLAWTQEDGGEIIRRSDGAVLTPVKGATVFSSDMTNKLWDFANDPASFLNSINGTSDKDISLVKAGNSISMDVGGFDVTVVANNPTEFAQQLKQVMASDKNAQKMIQEITLGQSLGKNSLNVNMYK